KLEFGDTLLAPPSPSTLDLFLKEIRKLEIGDCFTLIASVLQYPNISISQYHYPIHFSSKTV
ncbi:MAG: hypothetical protein AAB316_21285, partial [Bacteroidota bacterium]